uniref:Uncharacterized protein n=1 Tax=Tanacetum cinerariifolium TaxID=118510 RepID=A0A6L2L2M0_TANCI|nr:hypothetical protein [Tanacetum cinerariifolium]
MVVIGQDVVTYIVKLLETNVIEENDIDMNVMQDVIEENEIDMNVMQDDLNETTIAVVVDVYDIDPEFVPKPNGHKYWVPNVHVDEKPKIDTVFNTFDDAYGMYKEYAVKARFSIRIVGTNAFKVFDFVKNHNHPLIDASNMDLSRARRQLEFGEYMFIHRASLSNIGPQKAHRLRVALLGGFDKVRGMPIDWNNFKRCMNKFISERDAQMLVDKMVKRQQHVPEFSFYHYTVQNKLVRMFWADETMKFNCDTFGDIVSFDATYDTNKNVILQVFTQSHHRLCMWHITQKLSAKVLCDVDVDSDFRKDFHKLVWNVYITPNMYEIRDRWVPGYFSEVSLCGLMKTTSRLESSNVFFQVYSHHGNSLVHFMHCFESAMKKQRYTQRVLDNENAENTLVILTKLPIEHHACAVHILCSGMFNQKYARVYMHVRRLVLVLLEALKSALYTKGTREGIMNDLNKLKVFLAKVTNMKKELENDMPSHNEPQNIDGLKAIKKERMNRKVPFKHRECSKCGQLFHNKRTCDEKRFPDEEYQALLKNKKDAGDVDVNESDKDEEDVKVDDVDEDDGRDEHDEDEDED